MSADWGPVVVAVVLFILLSPGLLFQVPARARVVEFGNMNTSGIAILVHAIIYFAGAGIDVDTDGQDEDGEGAEEDEGVDENGLTVGLEATELHLPVVPRHLEQKSR
ncbi:hypothetical protein HHK36_015854 [Tetracentron sinense]|uniref:Uncharacterized protein n=1 Tax=Tetracentron sinense TaxID=13715 RepID=A0A834Z9Z9_TETSI|nr:hypothetical protein HHK36_015854 [Tetracentron sinense]